MTTNQDKAAKKDRLVPTLRTFDSTWSMQSKQAT